MRKWLVICVVGVAVVGGILAAVLAWPRDKKADQGVSPTVDSGVENKTTTVDTAGDTSTVSTALANGRYVDYSQQEISNKNYATTILFFHAPWCVECRGFEKSIESSSLPEGVQILKVDYDSSTELRKQYGVTIQSTFVRVNTEGEKQAIWVGYGGDKSVDAIVKNTQ